MGVCVCVWVGLPAALAGWAAADLPAAFKSRLHMLPCKHCSASPPRSALSRPTSPLYPAVICSGSQDRTAKVWKLPNLVLSLTLKGHKRGIWAVAFSPVDQAVATASGGWSGWCVCGWWLHPPGACGLPSQHPAMHARVGFTWGTRCTEMCQQRPLSAAPRQPTCLPGLPAGDKTVRLWSLADGACLRTFEGHLASVLRLDFLSAGTQILSAGADGLIKLWSVRMSGRCLPCGAKEEWVGGMEGSERAAWLWGNWPFPAGPGKERQHSVYRHTGGCY